MSILFFGVSLSAAPGKLSDPGSREGKSQGVPTKFAPGNAAVDSQLRTWSPVLGASASGGMDGGGDRAEQRDQNRVWSGLWAGTRFRDVLLDSLFARASLVLAARDDFRRLGPGRQSHRSAWVPHEVSLAAGWRGPAPDWSSVWLWNGAVGPHPSATEAGSPLFSLQVGFGQTQADPQGLWLAGPLPAARASLGLSLHDWQITAGIFGVLLGELRPHKLLGHGEDPLTGGWVGLQRSGFRVAALGSFYRQPGDSALPEWRVAGIPWSLGSGRAAREDIDLRSYGIWAAWEKRTLHTEFAGILLDGRRVLVGPDDGRNPTTSEDLRAALLFGRIVLGPGTAPPSGYEPADVQTSLVERSLPRVRSWALGFSLLNASTDGDDDDGRLRGYAGPAAQPTVMGGPFSVLLNGPGVGGERTPFATIRPGSMLVDSASYDFDDAPEGTPPPLDFGNRGLRMVSVHGAVVVSRALALQADGLVNLGRLHEGAAQEAIVAISLLRLPWSLSGRLSAVATATRYRAKYRQQNSWTGLGEPAQTEYYRRLWLVFSMSWPQ